MNSPLLQCTVGISARNGERGRERGRRERGGGEREGEGGEREGRRREREREKKGGERVGIIKASSHTTTMFRQDKAEHTQAVHA